MANLSLKSQGADTGDGPSLPITLRGAPKIPGGAAGKEVNDFLLLDFERRLKPKKASRLVLDFKMCNSKTKWTHKLVLDSERWSK